MRYEDNLIHTEIPMLGVPLTEVLGNKRVLIENHHGIVAYGRANISVKISRGIICIEGRDLEISCISKDRIIVKGHIDCIRFCCGG